MLTSVEDELERMNIGNRMRLCLCESVLKLKGTKQVEEFFETRNGRAKESPVLTETPKEGVGSGSREGESAQREWFTGATLFFAQLLDVGLLLDGLALIKAARMLCQQRGTIDNAHGLITGQDGQCATDSGVRNRVIIFVEAHVGSLPCTHLDALLGRKRNTGKGQKKWAFALPDLSHRERMVLSVPTLSRNGLTERECLGVEIRQVCVRTRREEGRAKIANGALDSPLTKSCQLQMIRSLELNIFA